MTAPPPPASGSAEAALETPTAESAVGKRDWVAWYEGLDSRDCKRLREKLLDAGPDEVRADPELRSFFLFHVEDLLAEAPPGTRRLSELHSIVMTLRGAKDADLAERRRKAVAFLLAEYQGILRNNPWLL